MLMVESEGIEKIDAGPKSKHDGVGSQDAMRNQGRARRSNRISVTVGLASVALIGGPWTAPASADVFGSGPPDGGWPHDGGDHTFCYLVSSTARIQQAAQDGMNNLDSQATIADSGPLGCTLSVDVRFGATATAVDGFYTCEARHPSGNCSTSVVRINPANMADDGDWKQTSCHEIGHSVGLTHWATPDCMSGDPAGEAARMQYDAHHVAHINSQSLEGLPWRESRNKQRVGR